MAHPNEDRFREGYEAFQKGDLETVTGFFTDDVVWHVPGNSPLSGDYRGKDEVLGFFARSMELTGGTLRIEVHDVLANDEHGVALTRVTAEREGRSLDSLNAHVVHITDGMVSESWFHSQDQYADDEFWA